MEAAPTNESEERQVEQAATTSSAETESGDNGYSAKSESASSARVTDEFDAPRAGPSTSTGVGEDAFLALRRDQSTPDRSLPASYRRAYCIHALLSARASGARNVQQPARVWDDLRSPVQHACIPTQASSLCRSWLHRSTQARRQVSASRDCCRTRCGSLGKASPAGDCRRRRITTDPFNGRVRAHLRTLWNRLAESASLPRCRGKRAQLGHRSCVSRSLHFFTRSDS